MARKTQSQARWRELVDKNLDAIGRGLVQKASEGNYNAAQLLLRLGGMDPDADPAADTDAAEARMFFLEMVEQMLGLRREDGQSAGQGGRGVGRAAKSE